MALCDACYVACLVQEGPCRNYHVLTDAIGTTLPNSTFSLTGNIMPALHQTLGLDTRKGQVKYSVVDSGLLWRRWTEFQEVCQDRS